ncbi:LysR family transcriptional regulator [Vibrio sp. SCSIO 43140]|uniref:LysR family transcriptional regulator n=1 Tax=Vibrio sp. SCSIO 43140 TaxID=2819100 RepID=UPI00207566F4|nr:LysR family transcriptional regulator [Vibrio sp. SCSIO 43140]MCG9787788.1 LysR family transcriptional regulator [Vibrio mediterranei]USD62587.1 LysR family transcriptional regulator [Vibrio sp. SCSIO 43140]
MAVTLEQLNAFVETVDSGSFKQASVRLGKHKSTVSGLIANLEAELGMELFTRKPRSLEITSEGTEIYRYAQSVIRECDLLDVKANSLLSGLPSSFTVAVDSDLMGADIANIWAKLIIEFPSIELKILAVDPMQVRSHVLSEQADIGFGIALFSGHHELTLADGYSFNVVFAASPQLDCREKLVSLEEVRGMLQVSALFMKQIAREETHNLSSRTIYSNNLRNTSELLKHTKAWAMLPEFICQKDIATGELNEMYISPTASERANQWSTEISWLTAKPRNAVMNYVIDELAKLPNR